eukprot:189274_1
MSHIIKSEAIRPILATQCQRSPSTSTVKPEFTIQPPTSSFSCEYCASEFNLKQSLVRHIVETHGDTSVSVKTEQAPFQSVTSESATYQFQGEDDSLSSCTSEQSVSSTSTPTILVCCICQLVFNSRSSLDMHMASVHSSVNNAYKRDVISTELQATTNLEDDSCTRSKHFEEFQTDFKELEKLDGNSLIQSAGNQYSCGVCQKNFTRECNLKSHLSSHCRVKPFSCDVCQKEFRHRGHLNSHIIIHSEEKSYSCKVCQKRFREKKHLKSHIMASHSDEKPFSCDMCQKTFKRKDTLDIHVCYHSNEKPHQYEICQKNFKLQGQLNRHLLVHTDLKPFTCEVCQKKYQYKNSLKRHVLIHSREKPHSC